MTSLRIVLAILLSTIAAACTAPPADETEESSGATGSDEKDAAACSGFKVETRRSSIGLTFKGYCAATCRELESGRDCSRFAKHCRWVGTDPDGPHCATVEAAAKLDRCATAWDVSLELPLCRSNECLSAGSGIRQFCVSSCNGITREASCVRAHLALGAEGGDCVWTNGTCQPDPCASHKDSSSCISSRCLWSTPSSPGAPEESICVSSCKSFWSESSCTREARNFCKWSGAECVGQ